MSDGEDPRLACFASAIEPTQEPKKFRGILSPEPGQEAKAVITSERVLIAHTHFQDNKTFPCLRSPEVCAFCFHRVGARVKGYLAGMDPRTGKEIIIELTANAVLSNPTLREGKVSLRGKSILLFRRGQAKNAPVVSRLDDNTAPTILRNLPQPFDLAAALLDMWGEPLRTVDVRTGEAVDSPLFAAFPSEANHPATKGA